MSVTVTQNSTKLWWLPPCNTGGPLSQFLVQLNGSTTLHHNLQQGRDLNESYNDVYNNSLLKAETSYEVTIIPVGYNRTYGHPKSEIFNVPPRKLASPSSGMTLRCSGPNSSSWISIGGGTYSLTLPILNILSLRKQRKVPAEPDKEKFKSLPPVDISSRSAVVTIHRDTFPNTEGTVRYFFILVARVLPAEPDEEKFKSLPPVESSSRSAVVTIHRDTFPNTEGTVRYFTILVAESFPHGPSHGWLTNGTQSTLNTWAKARQSRPTPPYQAHLPWPNPFQSSSLEEVEVEVGSQKCSETDYATYCDGPLESGTAYELRIRAFTATGYRDSQSIKFQTDFTIILRSALLRRRAAVDVHKASWAQLLVYFARLGAGVGS
ncbi:hypothetical protein J6590_031605 [Homalodisca vitripennis]|nr:hypothetical protein J6590_031605 [Homalodisca vitripennis]